MIFLRIYFLEIYSIGHFVLQLFFLYINYYYWSLEHFFYNLSFFGILKRKYFVELVLSVFLKNNLRIFLMNKFQEFIPSISFLKSSSKPRGCCRGVLFLNSTHHHAHVGRFNNNRNTFWRERFIYTI